MGVVQFGQYGQPVCNVAAVCSKSPGETELYAVSSRLQVAAVRIG